MLYCIVKAGVNSKDLLGGQRRMVRRDMLHADCSIELGNMKILYDLTSQYDSMYRFGAHIPTRYS